MGILIIIGVLILVTIPLIVVSAVRCSILDTVYGAISALVNVVSVIALLCVVIPALCIQVPKNKNYQNVVYEKQVLEYMLANKGDSGIGNELLYSDIVKFNKSIRDDKKYADNFWIGIFYNDKIAEIEYIEIDGIKPFN